MMRRRFRLLHHFGFALLLQAVLLELLCIDRLLGSLLVLRRPLFAAIGTIAPIRTITPVATAPAAASATTPTTPMLFAFLLRGTRRAVTLRTARLLGVVGLLRRTGRALIRTALALWTLGVLSFRLGELALLRNL
jgi:hypothetical protein